MRGGGTYGIGSYIVDCTGAVDYTYDFSSYVVDSIIVDTYIWKNTK